MNYQVITTNDKLFKVVRILREDKEWDLDILRQLWHCSHTFKKEGIIYFVREIEDAEYETLEIENIEHETLS
jgi:tRNA splicing endonuclease